MNRDTHEYKDVCISGQRTPTPPPSSPGIFRGASDGERHLTVTDPSCVHGRRQVRLEGPKWFRARTVNDNGEHDVHPGMPVRAYITGISVRLYHLTFFTVIK